jgi:hypothetical protein
VNSFGKKEIQTQTDIGEKQLKTLQDKKATGKMFVKLAPIKRKKLTCFL